MKQQMDEQAQSSKQIIQEELQNLSSELQESARHELSTIEAAIKAEVIQVRSRQESLIESLKTTSRIPLLVSIALTILVCLTIIGGTMIWEKWEVKKLQAITQSLKESQLASIKLTEKQKKVKILMDWGIYPHVQGRQKYLIFPKGMKIQTTMTKHGDAALYIVD